MALHESGEDYLEAVLVLRQERGIVRSIDVAQHLGLQALCQPCGLHSEGQRLPYHGEGRPAGADPGG